MNDTLSRYLTNIAPAQLRRAIQFVLQPVMDRYSAQMLQPAGIVITGAAAATAKTGATAVLALASANGNTGTLVSIAASATLTPNAGVTLINTFNVYTFYVDAAGVVTAAMGTPGATLALVVFPPVPVGKACIGGFTVNPTAGSFTGNTTALDAANTNVVFFSPVGPWDQSVALGATS